MFIDKSGKFLTDPLFKERIKGSHKKKGYKAVYSLSERVENPEVKSLYKLFMSCADEYDFATTCFASKAHLDHLKNIGWFMDGWVGCSGFRGYRAWLEDMEERDRSIGKKILLEKAKEGNVSAAKQLLDLHKPTETKGRPKKEDIIKAAAKKADEMTEIEQDIKRLNVVKLRG